MEEALCFGWIDSIIKKLDQARNVQRFSPRKSQSNYSQTNKERLKRLIKQGKVIPKVLDSLSDIDLEKFDYPTDILTAIRENKQAWKNYQKYSESYRRIRVAYIDLGRKRPGEFEKRLKHFIQKTEKDQQFGFGIEIYYWRKNSERANPTWTGPATQRRTARQKQALALNEQRAEPTRRQVTLLLGRSLRK